MRLLETSWLADPVIQGLCCLALVSDLPDQWAGIAVWTGFLRRVAGSGGLCMFMPRVQTVDHLEPQSRRAPPWPLACSDPGCLVNKQLIAAGPVACWKTKAICGAGGGEGVPALASRRCPPLPRSLSPSAISAPLAASVGGNAPGAGAFLQPCTGVALVTGAARALRPTPRAPPAPLSLALRGRPREGTRQWGGPQTARGPWEELVTALERRPGSARSFLQSCCCYYSSLQRSALTPGKCGGRTQL